ncbi:MAG: hypothetical protein IKJ41_06660 [Clostridia bacterium]|nr:hypothetical protein [Clostridia bacterium]
MGSVTIIIIIPLFLIFFAVSSVIGAVTGVDKTEVVLPYEPEKGIVWECDIQDGTPVELVETEIDGEKQIFYFKSNAIKDMIGIFAGLAKDLITKEPLDPAEHFYGQYYRITFTDENGNEKRYYAEAELGDDSKLLYDKAVIYSPDEYFAFDYTATAQQPLDGEYGWYLRGNSERCAEYYKADCSPTRTVTIVLAGEYFDSNKESYEYWLKYGSIDGNEKENESVKIAYRIVDGEAEILEEIHEIKENTENA